VRGAANFACCRGFLRAQFERNCNRSADGCSYYDGRTPVHTDIVTNFDRARVAHSFVFIGIAVSADGGSASTAIEARFVVGQRIHADVALVAFLDIAVDLY
jgi:hypothetical protein